MSVSRSVMSNSFPPHGVQTTRLLCSWDSPGKNIGVGCHAFLQGIFPNQESNQGLLPCRQILHHLRQLAKSSRRDNNKDSELNACVCSVMSNSATPWTAARQAPLSMGFSRQEYWSGLPCLPPGDLPNPGVKPGFSRIAGRFFTL